MNAQDQDQPATKRDTIHAAVLTLREVKESIARLERILKDLSQIRPTPKPKRVKRPIEKFLSIDELALRWKVSKKTIRRLRQLGKLPKVRLSRNLYRFAESEIIRMENAGETDPAIIGPKLSR
jgi:excisionase family DNA binding protein